MKISVWQRHYVSDDKTLEGLRGIVERTMNTNQKKPHIAQALFIQYPANLGSRIKEEITKEQKKLIDKNVTTLSSVGYGAGFAWYNTMFNFLGEKTAYRNQVNEKPAGFIKVLVDGDQYNIDDSNVLDGIEEISKELIDSDELFGISARDMVSLANTAKLDNSRKIEEMYHAKAMNNIKISNPFGIELRDVPEIYQKLGDPVPGLYGVNAEHSNFLEFLNACSESCLKANLNGYAGDPYAAIKASSLTKVVPSVRIPTRGNPPGPFNIENIKKKSIELGKTDISAKYLESVSDKSFQKELSKVFQENLVAEVTNMILEGLKEGMAS